jgi:phage baseplate assembly protein W
MIHTPQFPLSLGSKTLFSEADNTKQVVLFHLRNLILTNPGEKISDPDYGVGIRSYLFENITRGVLNNIAKDIDLAIKKYLGYIDVTNITVASPPDSNYVSVKVSFEIPSIDISDDLLLEVSNT